MAIVFQKTSGSGNSGKINITSDVYKGRTSKYSNYKVKTSQNVEANIRITQVAAALYVKNDLGTVNINNESGIFTITGVSNAPIIEISYNLNNEAMGVHISSISINDTPIYAFDSHDGEIFTHTIPGDPGATGEYKYSITFIHGGNNTITVRECLVNVKAIDGDILETSSTMIRQSEGSAYIYVNTNGTDETSSANINIAKEGTRASVYVLSNIDWSINQI